MSYLVGLSKDYSLTQDQYGWYSNEELDISPLHIKQIFVRSELKTSQWQALRDAYSRSKYYYRKQKRNMKCILHLENDIIITG
jgi:hypothetical protein